MSNLKSPNLGWGERLAIINKFGLSDVQATTAFGVSAGELQTARQMVRDGTFSIPESMNYVPFEEELASFKKPTAAVAATSTPAVVPAITIPSSAPITATKPAKEAKKRGRKGTKIAEAFAAVPTTPINADEFATSYDVSIAVLRQATRFDKSGLPGLVKVKKDRTAGVLLIWREIPAS